MVSTYIPFLSKCCVRVVSCCLKSLGCDDWNLRSNARLRRCRGVVQCLLRCLHLGCRWKILYSAFLLNPILKTNFICLLSAPHSPHLRFACLDFTSLLLQAFSGWWFLMGDAAAIHLSKGHCPQFLMPVSSCFVVLRASWFGGVSFREWWGKNYRPVRNRGVYTTPLAISTY